MTKTICNKSIIILISIMLLQTNSSMEESLEIKTKENNILKLLKNQTIQSICFGGITAVGLALLFNKQSKLSHFFTNRFESYALPASIASATFLGLIFSMGSYQFLAPSMPFEKKLLQVFDELNKQDDVKKEEINSEKDQIRFVKIYLQNFKKNHEKSKNVLKKTIETYRKKKFQQSESTEDFLAFYEDLLAFYNEKKLSKPSELV
jgi:hypothetical protein